MAIYKVRATQLVYFTVLVEAENENELDYILPTIYPDDCYEHSEIDWQIDSVSEASKTDTNNFPLLERAEK
jgi:hypothetical protein